MLDEKTFERDMIAAVDRNHERAVRKMESTETETVPAEMPMWQKIAVVVLYAAIIASSILYAMQ